MSRAAVTTETGTAATGRRTRMRVVRAGQAGPTVDVVLVEVTSAGVGLLHAEPLEAGDELMLVSAGRRAGEPATVLLFTVVRCQSNPAGGFAIDAQFHRALPRRSDPSNPAAPDAQPKSMRLAFVG